MPRVWMNLSAFQVLDSHGVPTVRAVLKTSKGIFTATAPSGTTTGKKEAIELRDNTKAFGGKSVETACRNVSLIAKWLPPTTRGQAALDSLLLQIDNSKNKSKLGANALLAISLVFAKANASQNNEQLFSYFSRLAKQKPRLPLPMAVMASGDKHGGNCVSIQEFMLLPTRFSTFADCTRAVAEIYHELSCLAGKKTGALIPVGCVDFEGGLVFPFKNAVPILELIMAAIDVAGYNRKVKIALDCAASEFYNEKTKKYNYEGKQLTTERLADIYRCLISDFPIVSIEDPFHEEDFAAFAKFLSSCKKRRVIIVGDDLLTTNPSNIRRAVSQRACNALLLKPNQIGTVTEALQAAKIARNASWKVIASHRSGDSEDTFLADLAVGLGCEAAKIGGPCRGERTAKYNRLLFLEAYYKLKLAKWA